MCSSKKRGVIIDSSCSLKVHVDNIIKKSLLSFLEKLLVFMICHIYFSQKVQAIFGTSDGKDHSRNSLPVGAVFSVSVSESDTVSLFKSRLKSMFV